MMAMYSGPNGPKGHSVRYFLNFVKSKLRNTIHLPIKVPSFTTTDMGVLTLSKSVKIVVIRGEKQINPEND